MADYNGWSNYETWAVNLWLTNEESSSRYWERQAKRSEDVYELAKQLKSTFEESMPDLGATLWSDLLGAAFSEVNWDEIARNLRSENDS